MAVSVSGNMIEYSPILFIDFNQDFTSLCVGTRHGYSLLSTDCDEVLETYSVNGEPIVNIGRLFTSNLVSLVSLSDPRRLLIFHSRRGALICDYRYSNTVLSVKMNRQRLVVCLEKEIFIHNIRTMDILHRIEDTPSNRNGVIAFSSCPEKCLLAYPGSNRVGNVHIFDALSFTNVTSIAAHDGVLAALVFNVSSTLLATASERGTVVRVFAIPYVEKVMEFRRGLVRYASICSLNFSMDNRFLVCSSNTETVHVFKLYGPASVLHSDNNDGQIYTPAAPTVTGETNSTSSTDDATAAAATGSWTGSLVNWVGGALKAAGAAYLPNPVAEVLSQDRSFAFARIPSSTTTNASSSIATSNGPLFSDAQSSGSGHVVGGFKKTAALIYQADQHRLLVAGLDGFLYTFNFDPVRGGEATLWRTQSLLSFNNLTPRALAKHQQVDAPPPSQRSFAAVAGSHLEPPAASEQLLTAEVKLITPSAALPTDSYDKEFPAIQSSPPAPSLPPPSSRKKP